MDALQSVTLAAMSTKRSREEANDCACSSQPPRAKRPRSEEAAATPLPCDLIAEILLKNGLQGVLTLTQLNRYFAGLAGKQSRITYIHAWQRCSDDMFVCLVRVLDGKKGRDVYYRWTNNFKDYWQRHSSRFRDDAQANGFPMGHIYRRYWPRSILLTARLMAQLLVQFTQGLDGSGSLKIGSLRLFPLEYKEHEPRMDAPGRGTGYNALFQNRRRPPLPTPPKFENHSAPPPPALYGPGVVYYDSALAALSLEQEEVRRKHGLYILHWENRKQFLSPVFKLALSGVRRGENGMRDALLLGSSVISKRRRQVPDTHLLFAPHTFAQNRHKQIHLSSSNNRIKLVGTVQGDGSGVMIRVDDGCRECHPEWPHRTVFRAGIVSWMQRQPRMDATVSGVVHAILLADLIDIEALYMSGLAMYHDQLSEDEDVYSTVAGRMWFALTGMIGRESIYRRFGGDLVAYQFCLLTLHEYDQVMQVAHHHQETPERGHREPCTIEEFLSESWPGYHPALDPLMQADDGASSRDYRFTIPSRDYRFTIQHIA